MPGLKLQFDFYHAQIMAGDLAKCFERHQAIIGHVQIAGVPERHEPDTRRGQLSLLFDCSTGWATPGWVGCEYFPAGRPRPGSAGRSAMASRPRASCSPPAASGSEARAGRGRRTARRPGRNRGRPAVSAVRLLGRAARPAGLVPALRREPLVHFVVLGALLFGGQRAVRGRRARDDRDRSGRPSRRWSAAGAALGRPLSEAERALLVQGLADDAVLLREAYRRGLEQDALVEQHLVQKMRFFLSEELPEPSEAELRALLEATRALPQPADGQPRPGLLRRSGRGAPRPARAAARRRRTSRAWATACSCSAIGSPAIASRDLAGLFGADNSPPDLRAAAGPVAGAAPLGRGRPFRPGGGRSRRRTGRSRRSRTRSARTGGGPGKRDRRSRIALAARALPDRRSRRPTAVRGQP